MNDQLPRRIDGRAWFGLLRAHLAWPAAGRGLVIAASVVVAALSIASVAAATPASGASRVPESQSKPIRAVPPPTSVAVALRKTQRARYVVLSETSQTGPVSYEVDNVHGRSLTLTGRKVSLIQIRAEVYAPDTKGGCYVSAKRSTSLLPNVAGMLLPSGIAALHYTLKGKTIRWTIKTATGYQPHGTVTLNAAGRIVSGTVYSGPGAPLTATISYPAKGPKIAAPAKLCRNSATPHAASNR